VRPDELTRKAELYLEALCSVVPHRRTGSPGNREATEFFAETIESYGYGLDTTPFDCLDHIRGGASLTCGRETFDVHISPYSLGCEVLAQLVAVSTVEELERSECFGEIILMQGPLCDEPLMPKNFAFYNPEHHQRIVALLEHKEPAAIVTATGKNPEQAGALHPFPLIVDGDFQIPSVFCSESTGERLAAMTGRAFRLEIDARRLPSKANNVVARGNVGTGQKVVIAAHIDAYEGSPGALDNASGTTVLLLLAEMLADCAGVHGIEIVALNGEDHYSAAGQMDYLERYGGELESIFVAVNVDGVGFERGGAAYSFYGCPLEIEQESRSVFQGSDGLVEGEPWYSGDHMIFVQAGVPAIAFTSDLASELSRTVTHTRHDTPDLVDAKKLVELARALDAMVRSMVSLPPVDVRRNGTMSRDITG